MDWTAYIADDGAIYFQGRFERAAAESSAMPMPDQVSRIRPGESFEGRPFEYWRALLEERSGATVVEMITDHLNPPDFPCPPEGCPQHPRDDYEDMSRQIEHWQKLLRKA